MTKAFHPAALLLALCAHWLPAQAQNVYRCGESYSNQPCAGATVVPTDDPRSAAQRAQTDAATRRDARSAQVLESERLKQEGKPAQAVIPETAPQAVAPRKPGDAAPKKKKKAEKKTAKKKPAKTPEA
ncbi:MAG TPA: hypothetical protein VIM34_20000 [Burkholderiaceae bacterium]